MQNPRQYKIPDWFLNRQKDVKDGKYSQVSDGRRELLPVQLWWKPAEHQQFCRTK